MRESDNDMLQVREIKRTAFRKAPIGRTSREIIASAIPDIHMVSRVSTAFLANRCADFIKTISILPRLQAEIMALKCLRPFVLVPLPISEYTSTKIHAGLLLIRLS